MRMELGNATFFDIKTERRNKMDIGHHISTKKSKHYKLQYCELGRHTPTADLNFRNGIGSLMNDDWDQYFIYPIPWSNVKKVFKRLIMLSIEDLKESLLSKCHASSLAELAELLPSGHTTDIHVFAAKDYLASGDTWKAFHHLALAHCTILYHRITQNFYRNKSNQANILNDHPDMQILRPSNVEETKQLIRSLPTDWTLLMITNCSTSEGSPLTWKRPGDPATTPHVYISRVTCGPSPSLLIQKVKPPEDTACTSILEEMSLIKSENNIINQYYREDISKYVSKRTQINNRMRNLVYSMGSSWLKLWLSLFVGSLPPSEDSKLNDIMKKIFSKCDLSVTQEQFEMIKLIISIPKKKSDSKGHLVYNISVKAAVAQILQLSVRSDKVKSLVLHLETFEANVTDIRNCTRNPLILILDKEVLTLPWEMLPVMTEQPVTRMPSLSSLALLYDHHSTTSDSILVTGINPKNGLYVLDPENNLPRTKERLKDCFLATNWKGFSGEKPSPEEFQDALLNKDVFVYVGHGSGSQYLPSKLVDHIECRSLVLLYGCSSVGLASRGRIVDPWGVLMNYLAAKCPCVVGMQWEVMDRDTDILTKIMLAAIQGENGEEGTPLEEPPTSVAVIVAKARPACSWYLISAALVVYGLPLHVLHK